MIERLFQFDEWANSRVLEALGQSPVQNPRALHLMAHILVAQKIWLERLNAQDTVGTNKAPSSKPSTNKSPRCRKC